MIERYRPTGLRDFNSSSKHELEKYFSANFVSDDKIPWFYNLLDLAKEDLGLAHCVQHDATAHYILQARNPSAADRFRGKIGCYSSVKKTDSMILSDNKVNGRKHWISNLHKAAFAVLRVPDKHSETFVLFDLAQTAHVISFDNDQLGLDAGRAGTLEIHNHPISDQSILGSRAFSDNQSVFTEIIAFHDYCFLTNYLGCITHLLDCVRQEATLQDLLISNEILCHQSAVSALAMMWKDNLASVNATAIDDEFWHRRNSQYVTSKKILIDLISLALGVVDSTWMMPKGHHNQVLRDALVYSVHMQSLYKAVSKRQTFAV